MFIQCTKCLKDIKKWKYEIEAIKDKTAYICKQCIHTSSKEERTCPVCKSVFTASKKHKKITCSRSCSNSYFRVGEQNGNWKQDTYRSTCFLHHDKKCVVCNERNVVAVHHYNGDHSDNRIENLVPMCPTHHQYMHSKYRETIESIVDNYVSTFKIKH